MSDIAAGPDEARRVPHPLAIQDGLPQDVLLAKPIAADKFAEHQRLELQRAKPVQVIGVVHGVQAKLQGKDYYKEKKKTPKGQAVEGEGWVAFNLVSRDTDGVPCLMSWADYGKIYGNTRIKVGSVITAAIKPGLTSRLVENDEPPVFGYLVEAVRKLRHNEIPDALLKIAAEIKERSETRSTAGQQERWARQRNDIRMLLAELPAGQTKTKDEICAALRAKLQVASEDKIKDYISAIEAMIEDKQLLVQPDKRDDKDVIGLVLPEPVTADPIEGLDPPSVVAMPDESTEEPTAAEEPGPAADKSTGKPTEDKPTEDKPTEDSPADEAAAA